MSLPQVELPEAVEVVWARSETDVPLLNGGATMEFAQYWARYCAEIDRARLGVSVPALSKLLQWLEDTRTHGRCLIVLGNGGSAASASHWVCDFGRGTSVGASARFKVLSPNEQLAWHTGLANDASYADALAEQVRTWIGPEDLVVALSVSGDSENLVRACAAARSAHARVVAIVGARGGRLAVFADLAIIVPSTDYGIVEDVHMTINHALSQFLHQRAPSECAEGSGGSV